MNDFKTPIKGTPLQIIKLKGKDYLPVAQRLVWFREEHPDWSIHTSYIKLDGEVAICKAEISNEKGECLSTGHKMETPKGFQDYIEKAETGAIGRALALIGYGTQFAPEISEEDRIVDSPVIRSITIPNKTIESPMLIQPLSSSSIDDMDFVVNFGQFKGKRLSQIPHNKAKSYAQWLIDESNKSGKKNGPDAQAFIDAVLG